ncbi:glycan-binding surface protein [Flavitalea flava]
MNKIAFHITKRTILILLVAAGIIQVSCQKSGNSGKPVITHVRAVDSTARDSFFVKTYPGTLIVIQGSNFDGLQHVYFNEFDAPFTVALTTSTNIIITIPSNSPTAPPLDKVSNTIRVVTNHGMADFDFQLILTPPIIVAVSNENAQAGSTLFIGGSSFYGISKVEFPGGIAASDYTVISPTLISVTVPAGITAGDTLRVYGAFGTGASPFIFDNWLSPGKGVIANFDGGTSDIWSPPADNPYYGWSQQQWVGKIVTDPTVFPGGTGNCVEINPAGNKPPGDNSWWQDANSIITNTGTWVDNTSDPIGNYAMKFEANVKNWTAGSIWVGTSFPDWSYLAEFAPWKKATGGKFSSNGWITVTIPLSQFLEVALNSSNKSTNAYTPKGAGPSGFSKLLGGGGLFFIMYSNDGTTTIPGDSFAFGIDNIRVVKIR